MINIKLGAHSQHSTEKAEHLPALFRLPYEPINYRLLPISGPGTTISRHVRQIPKALTLQCFLTKVGVWGT